MNNTHSTTSIEDISKDIKKIKAILEQKYWKNPGVIIFGLLAILAGVLIASFDCGQWLYLKYPIIYKYTHSDYNGAGYWIFAVTVIIALLGIPKDKSNYDPGRKKYIKKYLIVDILLIFFIVLLVIYLFFFAIDLEVFRRNTYFKNRQVFLEKHRSKYNANDWEIPAIEIDPYLGCEEKIAFDFSGKHQKEAPYDLKLNIRFCQDQVDAGVLSPEFVSTNTKLFELMVDMKLAKIKKTVDKDGNPEILKLKKQIGRYQKLSKKHRNFKEFIRGVDPDTDIQDILVFLYYLDTTWGNTGMALKERALKKIKEL